MLSRRDFLRGAAAAGAAYALRPVTAHATVVEGRGRLVASSPWAVVEVRAPADGTDATDAILDQILSAAPRTVLRFAPGQYRVDGSLYVPDRRQLVLQGPATFYATDRGPLDAQGMSQRRHWWFDRCDDIRIRDLHVRSTNLQPDQREGFGAYLSQYEFEHGFAFHGCSNVSVQRCSSRGTWGDGFYVGNSSPSRNVILEDLEVSFNGRQGIAISNADDVRISNVRILNTRRAGIDLEPATGAWAVRRVRIEDSFINGYHVAFAAGGNGDVSDVVIRRNRVRGPGVPWVYVGASDGTQRRRWRVMNNTIENALGSPVAALRFHRVDDILVNHNTSPIAPTQSRLALELSETGRAVITGNDFRQATILHRLVGSTGPIDARGNLLS